MSLETPDSIRTLQEKLHAKAKREPSYRFYSLYDKVHRRDVLEHAYERVRENRGAPGVDGETFEDIKAKGLKSWLTKLQEELRTRTYTPKPVRRVHIPKPGGGERPLGIPCIRDRVVQMAALLILGPIFEADFPEEMYGYREGRSAWDALQQVCKHLRAGHTEVVDADLSKYFDTIPHTDLMKSLATRISDGSMLELIRKWLKVPAVERDEAGREKWTGGRDQTRGTPQGGVLSPLLANIYMNRYLKGWRKWRLGEKLEAKVVNYADDFVILCRGTARQALEITRKIIENIGLKLNEEKTRICDGRKGQFVFLGYACGRVIARRTGRRYLGVEPSKKATVRCRERIREILRRGRTTEWEEVAKHLNWFIGGWVNYFQYGNVSPTYGKLNGYLIQSVRRFLCRRRKIPTQGIRRIPWQTIFTDYGVKPFARESARGAPSYALR